MTSRKRNLGLTLLPATAASVEVMAALHAACFDEAWDAAAMADVLEMPGVFATIATVTAPAAKVDGPVGFILFRVAADESEILTIAVLPSWRDCGIATQLLENACALAADKGSSTMFLEVSEANGPAVALYRKCGFSNVGRRSGYYRRVRGGRESALIMARQLGGKG
jgi:ribosomal-protein-alanine N-acetyltransferase